MISLFCKFCRRYHSIPFHQFKFFLSDLDLWGWAILGFPAGKALHVVRSTNTAGNDQKRQESQISILHLVLFDRWVGRIGHYCWYWWRREGWWTVHNCELCRRGRNGGGGKSYKRWRGWKLKRKKLSMKKNIQQIFWKIQEINCDDDDSSRM